MENENFSASSLFFMLSRFTLLSERNLVYMVYKFYVYSPLYICARGNVNYDYIYAVDTSNLNSRTVATVIARIATGSFNIPRQSPFPASGFSFLSYPAAFRARKLPSHVGGATNHVRRTRKERRREGGRAAQKSRAEIPRRMSAWRRVVASEFPSHRNNFSQMG